MKKKTFSGIITGVFILLYVIALPYAWEQYHSETYWGSIVEKVPPVGSRSAYFMVVVQFDTLGRRAVDLLGESYATYKVGNRIGMPYSRFELEGAGLLPFMVIMYVAMTSIGLGFILFIGVVSGITTIYSMLED